MVMSSYTWATMSTCGCGTHLRGLLIDFLHCCIIARKLYVLIAASQLCTQVFNPAYKCRPTLTVLCPQDDARKYPAKENVGFMWGSTGGFLGGEVGVRQFVEQGKVMPADEEVVRKRRAVKDATAVVGLVIVSTATLLALRQLGLVDFDLPAVSLPNAGDAAGSASDAVAGAASNAPLRLQAPSLELTESRKIALAAVGIPTGSILLFKAASDGVVATARSVGATLKRTAARSLVLVGAAAVGYFVVLN